ncbi:MAG TPA: prepilin peptidase, partial [Burkholderiaceae bacterium]
MMTSASACLLWLLLVAVYDLRQRRVPNWLVLAGAVLALAALAFGSNPFESTWRSSLFGAAIGFGCLLWVHAIGHMGAGDVKFAGILGLWVGFTGLLPIWIISSLLAAFHGLLWLLLERRALYPRLAALLFRQRLLAGGTPPAGRARFIPYAAYLALA